MISTVSIQLSFLLVFSLVRRLVVVVDLSMLVFALLCESRSASHSLSQHGTYFFRKSRRIFYFDASIWKDITVRFVALVVLVEVGAGRFLAVELTSLVKSALLALRSSTSALAFPRLAGQMML